MLDPVDGDQGAASPEAVDVWSVEDGTVRAVEGRVAPEHQRLTDPGVEIPLEVLVRFLERGDGLEAGGGRLIERVDRVEGVLLLDPDALLGNARADGLDLLQESRCPRPEHRAGEFREPLVDEELEACDRGVEDSKALVQDLVPCFEQRMFALRADEDGRADDPVAADSVEAADALLDAVRGEGQVQVDHAVRKL